MNLSPSFSLAGLAGTKALLGTRIGWTLEEFSAFAEQHKDSNLIANSANSDFFYNWFRYGGQGMLNTKTYTCSFDTGEICIWRRTDRSVLSSRKIMNNQKQRNIKLRSDAQKTWSTMLSRIVIPVQRDESCLLFGKVSINIANGKAILATTDAKTVAAVHGVQSVVRPNMKINLRCCRSRSSSRKNEQNLWQI